RCFAHVRSRSCISESLIYSVSVISSRSKRGAAPAFPWAARQGGRLIRASLERFKLVWGGVNVNVSLAGVSAGRAEASADRLVICVDDLLAAPRRTGSSEERRVESDR